MLAASARKSLPDVTSVVVFGDSYQDSGRILDISSAAVAANIPGARLEPAAPDASTYWRGRWSNGPTMVEVLARRLGVPLLNYAVSGAKSTSGNYDAWLDYVADTGLTGQLDTFEATLKGRAVDPHGLFVVSLSTNDYFQFHDFRGAVHHPVSGEPTLAIELFAERVARNVCAGVERLIAHGARRIIVLSSYALTQSPLVSSVDPQAPDAQRFTDRFDKILSESVRVMRNPRLHLSIFPIGDRMRSIIAQHSAFSINDVVHPCQITIPKEEPACEVPDDFFWWDELHLTRHTHQILGDMLFDSLVIGRDQ